MSKQLIISLGREYGSGGHEIARRLADIYKLPLYDHNLLDEIAASRNLSGAALKEFDETRKNKLMSRTVNGLSSSPAENIAQLQFDFLRKKAASGESFVIVGRCSESVLKEYDALISIFILGDMEKRIERVMEKYQLSVSKARKLVREKDFKRKRYHNSYSENKWGDARNYDITLNSSRLPMEETVRILTEYIDARRA